MTLPARPRLHPLVGLLLASFALTASCIERPYSDTPATARTQQFDRSSVRDALINQVPGDAIPVGANFGNAAELVAYRVEPAALIPGGRTRITLYWRCLHELEPWHIFVHLDDATGATPERIHAEHDPVQGRFPTDAWRTGDLIADAFAVQAGTTPLALYLGFYAQGESRLPLESVGRGRDDGNNRLWVGNIPLAQ